MMYLQTGDTESLPLLCQYPVKAQYLSEDPAYLSCSNTQCQQYSSSGSCLVTTCIGTITFHVVNFRTDIKFVFFTGGFATPCVLTNSSTISFANPNEPLYGHLSSVDSTATSMKLTWVSGDGVPQQVQYNGGRSATSQVSTFTQNNVCNNPLLPGPAQDFGWHDPGYIHSAVMTGLQPSQSYTYQYGSDSVGWSGPLTFKTPPAAGANDFNFLIYGDMGKAPFDKSVEHYIQPGSITVANAMANDLQAGLVDTFFHNGDISYATGFLVEWDYFLQLIGPLASQAPYMTSIGNHERDYINSGSYYPGSDSGGECGVPYESYFQMPTIATDSPWYSIEQGSVHFCIISTEHDWTPNSVQYQWIQADLSSVDRTVTPWLVFVGHRPMYSSSSSVLPDVDPTFVQDVEPLLLNNKVDLAFWGHVHNYERTCAVYQSVCKAYPTTGAGGIDTYNNNNYSAPVHVVVGSAGFILDSFNEVNNWSLSRISEFGYARVYATPTEIDLQFVNATTMAVRDEFKIIKG